MLNFYFLFCRPTNMNNTAPNFAPKIVRIKNNCWMTNVGTKITVKKVKRNPR